MLLTLSLMAVGSAALALTPTYAQIGIAAPIMIVAARLLQGFAIGGEVGASTAMLMEYADDHNRGFYGSWQFFSQGLSFLMGSVISLALSASLSTDALESWGWRVPFSSACWCCPWACTSVATCAKPLHTRAQKHRRRRYSARYSLTIVGRWWLAC